jgi:hypothetical protein
MGDVRESTTVVAVKGPELGLNAVAGGSIKGAYVGFASSTLVVKQRI